MTTYIRDDDRFCPTCQGTGLSVEENGHGGFCSQLCYRCGGAGVKSIVVTPAPEPGK